MAKAAWCTVAPMTGNGNKTISISAVAHTGRVARSTAVTVQTKNGTKPSKSIAVTQAAKDLFITKVSGVIPDSISADGTVVTVTGKSNAKSIAIFATDDAMIGHEFKVNGILQADSHEDDTTPLFIINGDPGASGEYTFESKITIPKTIYPYTRTLDLDFEGYAVDGDTSNPVSFTARLTQAGFPATLSTDKASVALANAGTAQTVNVTSNDEWTVS